MDNINNQSPTIAILPPLPESEEVANNVSNNGSTSSAQQQSQQQQTQQQQIQPIIPTQQHHEQQQQPINPDISSPRLSSQWISDSQSAYCNACQSPFDAFLNRKHHCRLCGLVFCNNCSNTRSLIPPRKVHVSIVLSCECLCSICSLGDLTTSFDLGLPLLIALAYHMY